MDHVQDLVTLENSGKIHGQIHSHIILENHQNPMALNASKLRRVRYAEEPSRWAMTKSRGAFASNLRSPQKTRMDRMSSETRPSNVIGNLLLPVLAVLGFRNTQKRTWNVYAELIIIQKVFFILASKTRENVDNLFFLLTQHAHPNDFFGWSLILGDLRRIHWRKENPPGTLWANAFGARWPGSDAAKYWYWYAFGSK